MTKRYPVVVDFRFAGGSGTGEMLVEYIKNSLTEFGQLGLNFSSVALDHRDLGIDALQPSLCSIDETILWDARWILTLVFLYATQGVYRWYKKARPGKYAWRSLGNAMDMKDRGAYSWQRRCFSLEDWSWRHLMTEIEEVTKQDDRRERDFTPHVDLRHIYSYVSRRRNLLTSNLISSWVWDRSCWRWPQEVVSQLWWVHWRGYNNLWHTNDGAMKILQKNSLQSHAHRTTWSLFPTARKSVKSSVMVFMRI